MRTIYKLLVYTEEADGQDIPNIPDCPLIGFRGGIYHFSTAPTMAFHDCLEGSHFSDISQGNIILRGGEFSLVEEVKIKIVSREVLRHIVNNKIELLGCRVSMNMGIIGETGAEEKSLSLFKDMMIIDYPQIDENSFEIILADSALANAGQVNLTIPQGFGSGSQLETSFGEKCLITLYRQDAPGKSISQGIRGYRGEPADTTELEQIQRPNDEPLLTSDGYPAFAKSFQVRKVNNPGTGMPAKLTIYMRQFLAGIFDTPDRGPEISAALAGQYIQICSGTGTGNAYRISSVWDGSPDYAVVTLDRPVAIGEILTQEETYLRSPIIPLRRQIYSYREEISNPNREMAIEINHVQSPAGETDENSIAGISIFQFVSAVNRYAAPIMPGGNMALTSTARVANGDGTYYDAEVNFNIDSQNRFGSYWIFDFPAGMNGKTKVSKISKHQPRWRVRRGATGFWKNGAWPLESQIHISEGELVGEDSLASEAWFPIAQAYHDYNADKRVGLQATLYWRIDDLNFNGKYKIKPRFSIKCSGRIAVRALLVDDAGFALQIKNYKMDYADGEFIDDVWYNNLRMSLTRNEASERNEPTKDSQTLLEDLKNLLIFDSDMKAKYIYLQLFFDYETFNVYNVDIAALPVVYEQEIDIKDLRLVAQDDRDRTEPCRDIVRRTKRLCGDFGIEVDEQSFDDAGDAINAISDGESGIAFIPLKHGDKMADKLTEICRAANMSMFSDGSKLSAKYIFSHKSEWDVIASDIIKGSFGIRHTGLNSAATEWNFSANTWDGEKTLSLKTDGDEFPSSDWGPPIESARGSAIYREYLDREIKGFGAHITDISYSRFLHIGDKYAIKQLGIVTPMLNAPTVICKLIDVRLIKGGAHALFIFDPPDQKWHIQDEIGHEPSLEINLLNRQRFWQEIITGNMNIKHGMAAAMWEIGNSTLRKIKRKSRLDERYSKHQIAAFNADRFWLQNFLNTAQHNSFVKSIITFKVPADRIPTNDIHKLLLKRVTLKFGRFKNAPLEGWIISYAFAPQEDAVQLEFLNASPIEEFFWLDENLLKDQLTIDESGRTQEFYTEG